MSRILKTALFALTGLALSTAAQANCASNVCTASNTVLKPAASWTIHNNYNYDGGYYTGATNYAVSKPSFYGFSGQTATIPGLGQNESLQPTTCPVNVFNPSGGKVLGCYNVVKPVPQTTYYRIVRPIIYVRYPVPVAVPVYHNFNQSYYYGQYGHFNRFAAGCAGAAHNSHYGHAHHNRSRYGNARYGSSRYGSSHYGSSHYEYSHYGYAGGYSGSPCG